MNTEKTKCPGCGAMNRVPVVSGGTPACGKCKTALPWLVNAGESEFDSLVESAAVPVLVDLWAPWCGPCKTIAPILEQLSRDRAGTLRVVKVNVDNAPALQQRMGVQGIPTMVLFRDGNEVARQVGALPAASIAQWLDQALL